MFYFLILIGSVLIILGIYLEKAMVPTISQDLKDLKESDTGDLESFKKLDERLSSIERLLFDNILESENQADGKLSFKEDNRGNSLEKYKLLLRYEKENRSLEEICDLLNMQKGEVSLLKNLYKNY